MMGALCPWITFTVSVQLYRPRPISVTATLSSNGPRLSLEVGLDCRSQRDLWCVAQHQQSSTAATLQPPLLSIFSKPSAGSFGCQLQSSGTDVNCVSPPFTLILSYQPLFLPASVSCHVDTTTPCEMSGIQLKNITISEGSLRNAYSKQKRRGGGWFPVYTYQEKKTWTDRQRCLVAREG